MKNPTKAEVLNAIKKANSLIAKLSAGDADEVRREIALENGLINRYKMAKLLPKQRAVIKSTEIGGFYVLNETDMELVRNGKLTDEDLREIKRQSFVCNGYGDCDSVIACSPMRHDVSVYN